MGWRAALLAQRSPKGGAKGRLGMDDLEGGWQLRGSNAKLATMVQTREQASLLDATGLDDLW